MRVALLLLSVLAAVWLVAGCPTGPGVLVARAQDTAAPAPGAGEGDAGLIDPLGPNAACYVCHMTFVREELARVHLRAEVTCVGCHGASTQHANDEHIGATPPDVVYAREQVNEACRACHATHDVAPELVVQRWLERKLTEVPPACTDCHGSHRIGAVGETPPAAGPGQ